MASVTYLANGGTDRLVVKTICTHLLFFHEAGFEIRTQRRQGLRWLESDAAVQPNAVSCRFNDSMDPALFGATPQARPGYYKLSSEVLSIRRHCVWVNAGQPMPAEFVPSAAAMDARAVRNVLVCFTYDGKQRTLRHST